MINNHKYVKHFIYETNTNNNQALVSKIWVIYESSTNQDQPHVIHFIVSSIDISFFYYYYVILGLPLPFILIP